MVYKFDGTKHGKLRDMQAARRAKHPDLARGGTDFTQATHAAGTPKRTGKAWRNGRTRPTGPPRAATDAAWTLAADELASTDPRAARTFTAASQEQE